MSAEYIMSLGCAWCDGEIDVDMDTLGTNREIIISCEECGTELTITLEIRSTGDLV